MAKQKTKIKTKKKAIKIKGPTDQAKAEMMIMKQNEAYEGKKRKRNFFIVLDIIALASLIFAIYLLYQGKLLNGILTLLVTVLIFVYFMLRKRLNNKEKK
jgi:amino acid permease